MILTKELLGNAIKKLDEEYKEYYSPKHQEELKLQIEWGRKIKEKLMKAYENKLISKEEAQVNIWRIDYRSPISDRIYKIIKDL